MASNTNPINLGHSVRSLQGDFKRSSYFYWKHWRAYLVFSIGITSTKKAWIIFLVSKSRTVLTQPSFALVFSGCIPLGVHGLGSICRSRRFTSGCFYLHSSSFINYYLASLQEKSTINKHWCLAKVKTHYQKCIKVICSYISTIKVMRFGIQHSSNTVWIFKLHKAKAPGLICAFVLHDDTVHNLSILGEVIS